MSGESGVAGDGEHPIAYTREWRSAPIPYRSAMFRRSQALVPVLAGLLLLPEAAAQKSKEPERPKERDPQIEETVDIVVKAFKDRRGREDGKVITLLTELAERAEKPLHTKDEKELLKAFSDILLKGPLRKPELADVYFPAMDGLAVIKGKGGDLLRRIDDKKRFPRKEEWTRVRVKLIEAIGRTGDKKASDYLLEIVQRESTLEILAQAGDSLGEFVTADQRVRKAAVRRLSERLASFELEATAQPVDRQGGLNLNRDYAIRAKKAVTGPWLATMSALTGEKHDTGQAWSEWYRDHEDERWPARRKK